MVSKKNTISQFVEIKCTCKWRGGGGGGLRKGCGMAGGCFTDVVLMTSESCQQAACFSQKQCDVLVTVCTLLAQMAINRQTFPQNCKFERKQSGETRYSVTWGNPAKVVCHVWHVEAIVNTSEGILYSLLYPFS